MKIFWRSLLLLILPLAPLFWSASAGAAAYTYTGTRQGQTVNLPRVTNVTVENLSDATLVGQLQNFHIDEPPRAVSTTRP